MTLGLTRQQSDCISVIAELTELDHGIAPTLSEIAREMGMSSKGNVYRLLACLEERGWIKRARGRARAIELLTEPLPLPPDPEFVGLFDDPALVAALGRTA